jgi:hypothetical protein
MAWGSFGGGFAGGLAVGFGVGKGAYDLYEASEKNEREKAYQNELKGLGSWPPAGPDQSFKSDTGAAPIAQASDPATAAAATGGAENAGAIMPSRLMDDGGQAGAAGGSIDPEAARKAQRKATLSNPAAAIDYVNRRAAIDLKYGKMHGEGLLRLTQTIDNMKKEGYVEAISLFDRGQVQEGLSKLNGSGQDTGYELVSWDRGTSKVGDQDVPTMKVTLRDREGNLVNLDTAQTKFGLMGMKDQLHAYGEARRARAAERTADADTKLKAEQTRVQKAFADNLEEGLSREGRDPTAPGGKGGKQPDDGKWTKDHQAVLDDIRKGIVDDHGDKNPDPLKSDKVPNDQTRRMGAMGESMYRHSVKTGEPMGPAEVREVLKSGQFRTDIVARDESGALVRRAGFVVKDPVSGQPRAYFTDHRPVALTAEEQQRFEGRQTAGGQPAAAPASAAPAQPPASPQRQGNERAPLAGAGQAITDTVSRWGQAIADAFRSGNERAMANIMQNPQLPEAERRAMAERILADPQARSPELVAAARAVLNPQTATEGR